VKSYEGLSPAAPCLLEVEQCLWFVKKTTLDMKKMIYSTVIPLYGDFVWLISMNLQKTDVAKN